MKDELSDNILMNQFANCSMNAYNQIFHRYKNKLLNHMVFVFMIPSDNAEDIVQKSLIKVYEYKFKYKSSYQFSTWLFTIAKNLCLNEIKTNKRIVSLDSNPPEETVEWSVENGEQRMEKIEHRQEPVEFGIENESLSKVEVIKKEIQKLKEKYREVLIMRYVDNMSIEEISVLADKNINTVKSLLKRGLETLKDNMQKYSFE